VPVDWGKWRTTLGKVLTLDDLDRRVTALELAQPARGENALVRIERKVDAVYRITAELIAESEQRMGENIKACEVRMGARITEVELRLLGETERILTVVGAAEQRTAGRINDSEQRILVALEGLKKP
jgi:hypothetical protein